MEQHSKNLIPQNDGAIDGSVIAVRITNAILINYSNVILMRLSTVEILPKAAVQTKEAVFLGSFFCQMHAIIPSYCPHNKTILTSHHYVLSWTIYQREEWDFSALVAHPSPGRWGSCFLHQKMGVIINKSTLKCQAQPKHSLSQFPQFEDLVP